MIPLRQALPCAASHFPSPPCSLHLLAQQPDPNTAVYTIQQTVQAVVLDIVVTDRDGHTVPSLTAADFTVTEDKVPAENRPSSRLRPSTGFRPRSPPSGKTGDAPRPRLRLRPPLPFSCSTRSAPPPEDLYYARHQTADFLAKQPATLRQSHHPARPSPASSSASSGTTPPPATTLLAAVKADHEPPAWYVLRDPPAWLRNHRPRHLLRPPPHLPHHPDRARQRHRSPPPAAKTSSGSAPGLPALNSLQANDRVARDTIREAILRCSTALLHARLTVSTVDPKGLVIGTTELIVPSAAGTILTQRRRRRPRRALLRAACPPDRVVRSAACATTSTPKSATPPPPAPSTTPSPTTPPTRDYNGKYRTIRVTLADPNLKRPHPRPAYDALPTPPPSVNQTRRRSRLRPHQLAPLPGHRRLRPLRRSGHPPPSPTQP